MRRAQNKTLPQKAGARTSFASSGEKVRKVLRQGNQSQGRGKERVGMNKSQYVITLPAYGKDYLKAGNKKRSMTETLKEQ